MLDTVVAYRNFTPILRYAQGYSNKKYTLWRKWNQLNEQSLWK